MTILTVGRLQTAPRDFSESRYEVQLRYPTGWETIATLDPFLAQQGWSSAKQRWRRFAMRLLRDGKGVAWR